MASSFVFDIDVINEKGKEKRQLGISDVIYYEEKKKKKKKEGQGLLHLYNFTRCFVSPKV